MIETIELMKHSQLAPSCFPRSWPKPRHHLSKLIMNLEATCFVISFRINHIKYIVPWLDDKSRILNNIQYVAVALVLLATSKIPNSTCFVKFVVGITSI